MARYLVSAFHIAGEIIENCLPSTLLLFNGMGRFRIKGDADLDAIRYVDEFNRCVCQSSEAAFH